MIIDLLTTTLLGFLQALVELIPVWELDSGDWAAVRAFVADVAGIMRVVDLVIPVPTVMQLIVLGIAFALALAVWHFILFIYHQFWGAS